MQAIDSVRAGELKGTNGCGGGVAARATETDKQQDSGGQYSVWVGWLMLRAGTGQGWDCAVGGG